MPEWIARMGYVAAFVVGFFTGPGGAWWMVKRAIPGGDGRNV